MKVAGIFFAVLIVAIYYPVLFGEVPLPAHMVTQFAAWDGVHPSQARSPVADIGDLIDEFYPFDAYSAALIKQGTIPFWNPNVMAGMPLLAEPQSALFYPVHWLFYIFATPTAWTITLLLRAWLAAMFMALLMRSLGSSKEGAILAGMVFALGGFVNAWQGAPMGDTVIWLPFVCYCVHRLHREPTRRSLALTAFAFAMALLAGHPETTIHLVLIASVAALLLWAFPDDRKRRLDRRFVLLFAAAGVLAMGVSAIQLLPTAEWIRESSRSLDVIWPSFTPQQLLGFFTRDVLRGPNSAGVIVPNASSYAGMVTLLLAAIGLLHPSRRYVIWFAGLVIFGIAATFGIEPIHSLLIHTPVVRGLKNERLILLSDFGLAALAGFGISVVTRRAVAWVLVVVSFLTALYGVHLLQLTTQFKVELMRRPSFSRTLLLIALALIVWRLIRGERARWFPAIACALLAFDLGTFASGYSGFATRSEIFPSAPVFEFLKSRGSPYSFRVAQTTAPAHPSNSGSVYGLQYETGYEAIVPGRLQRFTDDFSENAQPYISFLGEKTAALRDRRLDMLNVKYIVVATFAPDYAHFQNHSERFAEVFQQGRVAVFENKTVLPRVFVVGRAGIRVITDEKAQLSELRDEKFDAKNEVVLESRPAELSEPEAPGQPFSGNVEVVTADVNRFVFRVQASTPAVLVVSQNFYPGWKATMDGAPTSVFPADFALTGMAVPAGNHEVIFVMTPVSFKLGAVISLISVLILAKSRRDDRV